MAICQAVLKITSKRNHTLAYTNTKPYIYDERHNFFSNLSSMHTNQAMQCAKFILHGNADEAVKLAEENPAILSCEVKEIVDHVGRRIQGRTPFQIAAMTGDFSLCNKELEEKNRGIVERLSSYLTENEIEKQLRAIFKKDWELENEKRIKPYIEAVMIFINEIIEIKAANYAELEEKGTSCVKKFKQALAPNPSEVITEGYIFDLQILHRSLAHFEKNIAKLAENLRKDKTTFFFIHGLGLLQASANVCDLQVFKKGLLINPSMTPDRSFNLLSKSLRVILPNLGTSYFIGTNGDISQNPLSNLNILWQFFAIGVWEAKKSALEKTMQRSAQNSWCLTM